MIVFTSIHKMLCRITLPILVMFFWGCSDSEGISKKEASSEEEVPVEGFAYIHSKGKTTVLGTMSKTAKADEQPAMKVYFDYDFCVGVHEVTQGEFGQLMNRSFKKDSFDYPQANVTFYDAVLYANALSKKYKKDTTR